MGELIAAIFAGIGELLIAIGDSISDKPRKAKPRGPVEQIPASSSGLSESNK